MKNISHAALFYYLFISCAQKVPPVGGKKDIINPKLIISSPKNQTVNFNGKSIELYFDEYVKVENINQNLIITPGIEGNYVSKMKPTGVKLTFDKPFKPNTTYNLNFRSTFKDITESNEAKNIRLVFSTGPQIDSLKVSGTVFDPLVNKPVFDALVGLYKLSDTLNIKKEKPYYFTKTDSLGIFNIENIQANNYKIYAIVDYNNNTIFNELTEKIGYTPDTLHLSKNQDNVNLLVVKQEKQLLKIQKTTTSARYANVDLNKGVKSVKIKFQVIADSMPYAHLIDKEVKFFNTNNQADSIKYDLIAIDSIGKEYNLKGKFIFKKPTKKSDGVKEELRYNLEPISSKAIENKSKYKFTFNKPIQKFDVSKLKILNDTLNPIIFADSSLMWNDNKNILTINIHANAKKSIRISVLENAFISIENDTLKKFNQDNPILESDDTGIITGEIAGAKGQEIIQLLNEKYEIVSEEKYKTKYSFKNVSPGKYYIRLISDTNKNGEWDSGDVEKNIIPEKIQLINKIIQVKANFELSGYNFNIQ